MANYRQIHVSIWKDEWFLSLEPEEKLLFIYLFSNSETTIAGIYKIAFPVICFETSLSGEFVKGALTKFEEADKMMYADGVMWIKNMRKFHNSNSPKVLTRIQRDLENIPYCDVKISYLYHIDTRSQEKEKEKEKEKENNNKGGDDGIGEAYTIYQENIGVLTPIISDEIDSVWIDIPPDLRVDWFKRAITEAVRADVRKWNYIKAILDRWIKAGKVTTKQENKLANNPELEKYRRQAKRAEALR